MSRKYAVVSRSTRMPTHKANLRAKRLAQPRMRSQREGWDLSMTPNAIVSKRIMEREMNIRAAYFNRRFVFSR